MSLDPIVSFSVHPDRSQIVLAVRGELEVTTDPHLRAHLEELIELGWREIVVDLRGVTQLDVGAVRVLVQAARRMACAGGVLQVVDGPPQVMRALELAGDELSRTSDAAAV